MMGIDLMSDKVLTGDHYMCSWCTRTVEEADKFCDNCGRRFKHEA